MKERYTPLVDPSEVQKHIHRIAVELIAFQKQIALHEGSHPLFVTLLDGGRYFSSRLMQEIANHSQGFDPEEMDLRVERDYMGKAYFDSFLMSTNRIHNRDVVMVDSMLGMGDTATAARQHLVELGAHTVSLAVLLEKKGSPRTSTIAADFVGMKIRDTQWVAGCGIADKTISPHAYRWRHGIWSESSAPTPDDPPQLVPV